MISDNFMRIFFKKFLLSFLILALLLTQFQSNILAEDLSSKANTTEETTSQKEGENEQDIFASYFGLMPKTMEGNDSRVLFYVNFYDDNNSLIIENVPFYTGGGVVYPLVDLDGNPTPSLNPNHRYWSYSLDSNEKADLDLVNVEYSDEELTVEPFVVKEVNLYAVNISDEASIDYTIKYQYADGTVAYPTYHVTLLESETKEVVSPAIIGAIADINTVTLSKDTVTETIVTYTVSTTKEASYVVEHHFEGLDGNFVADESLTETFVGNTNELTSATSKEVEGFLADQSIKQAIINEDGSTKIIIEYSRNSYFVIFNTGGGEYIPPMHIKYGANVSLPTTASRDGYVFDGFDTTITTMPAHDVNVNAKWVAKDTTYKVVVWVEDPNALQSVALNTDEVELYDTTNYNFHSSFELNAKTGDIITDIDKALLPVIKEEFEDKGIYETYANYSWDDTQKTEIVIAGDGSTTVNVYYTLKVYTLRFYGDTKNTFNFNGKTYYYWGGGEYTLRAKLGQNITDIYPQPSKVTVSSGKTVSGWRIDALDGVEYTNVSSRHIFTIDLISKDGNAKLIYGNYDKNIYNAYFEATDEEIANDEVIKVNHNGNLYVLSDAYSEIIHQQSSWGIYPKVIEGLNYVDKNTAGNVFSVYYDRIEYDIVHHNGTEILTDLTYTGSFGESLKEPTVITKDGYTFDGWYYDEYFNQKVDFTNDLIEHATDGELMVFAKWTPIVHQVTLSANGGTLLNTISSINENTITLDILHMEKVGELEDYIISRPGYIFAGWYNDLNDNNIMDDGEAFSLNSNIIEDVTIKANWIPTPNISYTVIHQFAGDDASNITLEQVVNGQTIDSEVTVSALTSNELISKGWSAGYYISDKPTQTITISEKDNIVIFTYSKPIEKVYTYQVQYLYNGEIISETETFITKSPEISIIGKNVTGYELMGDDVIYVELKDSENVIIFNYDKTDTEGTITIIVKDPEGNIIDTVIVDTLTEGTTISPNDLKDIIESDLEVSEYLKDNNLNLDNLSTDKEYVTNDTVFEITAEYSGVNIEYYDYQGNLLTTIKEELGAKPSYTTINSEGTNFLYWSNEANGTTNVDSISKDTLKLYEVVEHKVEFEVEGIIKKDGFVIHNENSFAAGFEPTKENNDFLGWQVAGDTTLYVDETILTYTITGPTKFVAVFKEHPIISYFNFDGKLLDEKHEIVGNAPSMKTVDYETEGTQFIKWVDKDGNDVELISKDITELYAVVSHDVNFYSNSELFNTTEIVRNNTVELPTTLPTLEDHRFMGWSTYENGAVLSNEEISKLVVTGEMNFYAIYIEEIKVTYYDYTGFVHLENNVELLGDKPAISTLTYPTDATLFVKWVDESGNDVDVITKDTTKLYAVVTHKVDFIYETTTLSSEAYLHDSNLVILENINELVKEDRRFMGWSSTLGGEVLEKLPTTVTEPLTYYAVYVNYELNIEATNTEDNVVTKVYDGKLLTFDGIFDANNELGESLTGVEYKYYADAEMTIEITDLTSFGITNVGTVNIYVKGTKPGHNDAHLTITLEIIARHVTINVPNLTINQGNTISDSLLSQLLESSIANITTYAEGNALINEDDLGEINVVINGLNNNLIRNNIDIIGLAFTTEAGIVPVVNSVEYGTINSNYLVTVNFGDVNVVSAPVITNPVTTPVPTATPIPTVNPTIIPTVVPTITPTVVPTPDVEDDLAIEDNQTPETGDNNDENITDENTPETIFAKGTWSLVNLILAIISLVSAIFVIGRFNKSKDENEYEVTDSKKHYVLLNVISAVVMIVIFVLTQDLTLKMVLVDMWTIVMIIIAIAQAIFFYNTEKKYEEVDQA